MEEDGGKCLTSGSQPGSKVAFVCLCVSSCTCVCVRRGFRNALGPARPRQAAVTPPAGLSCWVCSHGAFLLLLRGLAAPRRPDARPDALR